MQQAKTIFDRLTEVEKLDLRGATPGRVEYLADTDFRVDMPLMSFEDRAQTMIEVQALCILEFASKGKTTDFSSVTWKF